MEISIAWTQRRLVTWTQSQGKIHPQKTAYVLSKHGPTFGGKQVKIKVIVSQLTSLALLQSSESYNRCPIRTATPQAR